MIILLALLTCSCSHTGSSDTRTPQVILEVINDASTTIYPPGRTLTLRIYDNDDVEFDYYPLYTPDRVGQPFHAELRKSSITHDQALALLSTLDDLAKEPPTSYFGPTVKRSVDSYVKVTVHYRAGDGMREITLDERDSGIHLDAIGSKSLRELLKQAYNIQIAKFKEARGK